jgi:hypothetical protein
MVPSSKAGSKLKRSRSKSGTMTQEHEVSNHSVGDGVEAIGPCEMEFFLDKDAI